jgi:hypothetical protein
MEVFVLISKKMGHIRLNESSRRQTNKVKILVVLACVEGDIRFLRGFSLHDPSFPVESFFRIST